MNNVLKKLGPGLLFAGAAVGVSHLVQSTRAGADFGLGLVWVLLAVHVFKYPFFQFGPRYAAATGESLLDGYKKLGKVFIVLYFIITFATMFTIQTAVTIVTAGIASAVFKSTLSLQFWTAIITGLCLLILLIGKYKLLDTLMKVIIITLSISTIIAVSVAIPSTTSDTLDFHQILPDTKTGIAFLIAFMGWMPAPLDVSVWQSLWTVEKSKTTERLTPKTALFDFNIGYFATIFLGLGFMCLGYLVMFNSNETFSGSAAIFASQFIQLYTAHLGNWTYIIIGIAALTTMFSTTLTTMDASPRSMTKSTELLFNSNQKYGYYSWMLFLSFGTAFIFYFLNSEMAFLIKTATIISFLTAPFYAITNYILISSKHTPKAWHPSKSMHILSWLGIAFLISFSIWYLNSL
ncbi:NRAMP family divalent metal transporter [Formosa sp. S-31]|uniref:NRAMP family divalent metal transporter n=1 Tax=Formosa sp. S-31 TaxID=2790949 RepID=UPI003EBF37A8